MTLKVLAVALLAAAVGASAGQSAPAPLSISISANRATTKVGDPLVVSIDLNNLSDSTVPITTTGMAEAETIFDLAVHDSSGNPTPLTRYHKSVKGIDQGPGPSLVIAHSYGTALIKPQQTERWTSDLSKCFDLQPGVYTVQASFAASPSNKILSNTIKVTIVK